MCRSEWQSPQRSIRTSTSAPFGFGVSTMVSHNGASNLTSDWRRISAMAFSPLGLRLFGGPYIGQFARHGNKAGDRNGLGAPRWFDLGRRGEERRIEAERFQALAQHLAALAEGGGRDLLQRATVAGFRRLARH